MEPTYDPRWGSIMRRTLFIAAISIFLSAEFAAAQGKSAVTSVEPFKVGTFEVNGAPRVALVLRDELIVDRKKSQSTNPQE